jgi:hypothetical protein
MIYRTKWLAKPGGSVSADSQEPVSQASFSEMLDSVQALTNGDGHCFCLSLASQRSKFLYQPVCLGALNVQTHRFYLSTTYLLPGYPPAGSGVAFDGAAHAAGAAAAAA